MTEKQIKFHGYKHPLSNFYESNFRIGTFIYPTVEHYYQSQKSNDSYERMDILMADTPKEAKEMGKYIEDIKENWDDKKLIYMWKGLYAKFTQNHHLKKYLLDTKDVELVENSPVDSYWGRGKNWDGENKLGKMLMKLREEIGR
jgi:N-glycosidase YbiA